MSGNTSVGNGTMNQAWIATSEALYAIQEQSTNSITQNGKDQESMCHSMLEMSNNALSQARQNYEKYEQAVEAAKHASFWQRLFGDILGGLCALLSVVAGQPELAVLTIGLMIAQQTGGIKDLEKLTHSAKWSLFIGVAIVVASAAVGGFGAAAREGSVLGGTLLAGSMAIGSVGIQSNVAELTNAKLAMIISGVLMFVALVGGIVGGKLSLGDNMSSETKLGAFVSKAAPVAMGAGVAAQSSAATASGVFELQQASALESVNTANALSSFINDLRDETLAQGKAYMEAMEQAATTAAKENSAVAKGMAKSVQWAAQLVAHA